MSGVLPVIVTSDVDAASRPCLATAALVNKTQLAPVSGILGECDVPPRRVPRGRMRHMIHQAVVDARTPTVSYNRIQDKIPPRQNPPDSRKKIETSVATWFLMVLRLICHWQ